MLGEARTIAEQSDDIRTLADVSSCLAVDALFHRDASRAQTFLEEALAGYRAAADDAGIYRSLYLKAFSGFTLDTPDGKASGEQALAMITVSRAGWSKGNTLLILGLYRLRDGDVRGATDLLHEALSAFRTHNDQRALAQGMRAVASCSAAEGVFERAARLFGAADRLWELSGVSQSHALIRDFFADYEQQTRDTVDPRRLDTLHAEGREMSTDDAAEYALGRRTKPSSMSDRTATSTSQPLTRREAEIAQLVGEGLTNREIAAHLVISQRTAEAHVEHILTKLGFRSRTQIAAWICSAQPREQSQQVQTKG